MRKAIGIPLEEMEEEEKAMHTRTYHELAHAAYGLRAADILTEEERVETEDELAKVNQELEEVTERLEKGAEGSESSGEGVFTEEPDPPTTSLPFKGFRPASGATLSSQAQPKPKGGWRDIAPPPNTPRPSQSTPRPSQSQARPKTKGSWRELAPPRTTPSQNPVPPWRRPAAPPWKK